MEVKIDFTESAQENANEYYNRAKKYEEKKRGAERAVHDLEKKMIGLKKKNVKNEEKIIKVREKKWYEKFHWFFTENGRLVIGGRSAQQNEIVNSRYFLEGDLFFHADIFGASLVVLKDGVNSAGMEKEEAAEFAAAYSSAWKEMLNSVNVYSLKRDQVNKSTNKGSLGTGSFSMEGEREWYKNVGLGVAMYVKEDVLYTVPLTRLNELKDRLECYVIIKVGKKNKSDAAKAIKKYLNFDDLDGIMQQLPTGMFDVIVETKKEYKGSI